MPSLSVHRCVRRVEREGVQDDRKCTGSCESRCLWPEVPDIAKGHIDDFQDFVQFVDVTTKVEMVQRPSLCGALRSVFLEELVTLLGGRWVASSLPYLLMHYVPPRLQGPCSHESYPLRLPCPRGWVTCLV